MTDLMTGMSELKMTTEIKSIIDALTFDKRLWNYNDVAVFLNRSARTVADSISKRPDFPPAIRIDSHPLYQPEDVKKWALKFKEKH